MNIIGEVEGRTCVIVDDMIDTAGTLCQAAAALKDFGARRVVAYCTHPVLSGGAVGRIAGSQLDAVVVTDTIPLSADASTCDRILQLSLDELLAEAIRRVSHEESISEMFR
jgi:ribose-phosphate pyrophosphokinase